MAESTSARHLAVAAARIADHEHGSDVVVLNVGEVTIIADYFVLVSASNKRLARRLTEEIEARITDEYGEKPLRREGVGEFDWVVIDYGDVMVHVFGVETRDFYEIERLYSDVPTIEWRPPDEASSEPSAPSQSDSDDDTGLSRPEAL